MPQLSPTAHALRAPSKSNRWIPCPFSLNAPDDEPTQAADDGTEAHGLAAEVLTGERGWVDVPERFQPGVSLYVDHVRENGVEPIVERQWESIEVPEHFGTIDCLMIEDGHACIYDFKFGRWPVDATGNSQLLCYAGIVNEHFNIRQFHGVIVQPNAFKGPKVKVAEYTPAEVTAHRERVLWAVENPDHKEEGEHCRFCPLRKNRECTEGTLYGIRRGWK